jgi:catechol 2,3-dioxygenase-like lactoylglutathione lyase family enzyme
MEVNMSSTDTAAATDGAKPATVTLKLEVLTLPVSDVDRAKAFYTSLGWRLDADFPFDNGFRVVQFTPPHSDCSVQFGTKLNSASPGSARFNYLVTSDVEAARAELSGLGVDVSEVFHAAEPGAQFREDGGGRAGGVADERETYGSFVTFADPDGNTWLVQEITTRFPGRVWED